MFLLLVNLNDFSKMMRAWISHRPSWAVRTHTHYRSYRVKWSLSASEVFRHGVRYFQSTIATMAQWPCCGRAASKPETCIWVELGLGKVWFEGLCPKLSALLNSNVWVLVTMRLSKQTQLQGSIKIVHASKIWSMYAGQQIMFFIFKYWFLALGQFK